MFAGLLPSNFTASSTQVAIDFISALNQPIVLIIGISVGAIIIEILLTSHRK